LPGHEKRIPMAFLYGDKDVKGKNLATSTVNLLKRGQDKDFASFTGAQPIKDGASLTGVKLLQGGLDTQDFIVKYVDGVLKKRRELTAHDTREYKKYGYLWMPPGSRLPVIGKKMEEKEPLLFLLNCQPFMQ